MDCWVAVDLLWLWVFKKIYFFLARSRFGRREGQEKSKHTCYVLLTKPNWVLHCDTKPLRRTFAKRKYLLDLLERLELKVLCCVEGSCFAPSAALNGASAEQGALCGVSRVTVSKWAKICGPIVLAAERSQCALEH
jgi:hypothetical protein